MRERVSVCPAGVVAVGLLVSDRAVSLCHSTVLVSDHRLSPAVHRRHRCELIIHLSHFNLAGRRLSFQLPPHVGVFESLPQGWWILHFARSHGDEKPRGPSDLRHAHGSENRTGSRRLLLYSLGQMHASLGCSFIYMAAQRCIS